MVPYRGCDLIGLAPGGGLGKYEKTESKEKMSSGPRHKDGDLLAQVLAAPEKLDTKEEPKAYEEDWKKVGTEENVDMERGNEAEGKDGTGVEHVGVAEKYHGGIKDKGKCDAGWRNAIHSSPDETGSVQRLSSSPLKMQRSSSSQSGVRNPSERG
ncbi:hypothetical protein HID58_086914 [Brassica napus]|uniref:Uncharacterized protein n=1 Tax=Brassica napus TaxID=3708 RepID=A0ABQ7XRT3_BRANA|nr:hypothetical protein HID58_086914 [Brassica napus]